MTLEAPIQIDLSQENTWDQIDDSMLTDKEKELLAKQFTEETEGIISFTQEELEKFQSIISSEIPEVVSTELEDFIKEQKDEGLSSSDIMSEVEGENSLPAEVLDMLDDMSQKMLFDSSESVFSGVEISPIAQDRLSVALSLSMLQLLKENGGIAELLTTLQKSDTEDSESLFTTSEDAFQSIRDSLDAQSEIPENHVSISENGNANHIFMNTEEGIAFFSGLFDGSISNIKQYIESKNYGEGEQSEEVDIQALQEIPEISPEDAALIADVIDIEDEDAMDRLRKLGFFGEMLATILEVLQGFLPDENETEGGASEEGSEEEGSGDIPVETVAEEVVSAQTVRDFFNKNADNGVFSGMDRSSILALFPNEGELSEVAQNIIEQIEGIPGNESIEEKMQHLFVSEVSKVDGDSSQGNVPRISRYLSDMSDITDVSLPLQNADNTLNPENILTAIRSYKEYRIRNEQWVSSTENSDASNMTFATYFRENEEE